MRKLMFFGFVTTLLMALFLTSPASAELVGYYDFETGNGTTAFDQSGYGTSADGSFLGNPIWVAGKVGSYALNFDGSSKVDCGDPSKYDISQAITFCAWIKAPQRSVGGIDWQMWLSKGNESGWRSCRVGGSDTMFFGVRGNEVNTNGQIPAFDNTWHHVACVYDGTSRTLYIDGVRDPGSGAGSGPIGVNDISVQIGGNAQYTPGYWVGEIDEVGIFNSALRQVEIEFIRDHSIAEYDPNDFPPEPNEVWPDPQDPTTDWDFQRDFRGNANPSGSGLAWRMGMGFEPLDSGDFLLYNAHYLDGPGNDVWIRSGYGSNIWKNNTGALLMGNPANAVAAHPGPTTPDGDEYVKIRWVSPITSIVGIVGSFAAGDSGAVEAWIVKDGVTLFSQTPQTTADIAFDIRTEVVPGTIIDLVVGMGASYGAETTPVYAVITREDSLRCQDLPDSAFQSADLNRDCYVNLEDFAVIAQDWLKCNNPQDEACD